MVTYGAETVSFTVVKHFMKGRRQEAEGERVTVRTVTLGRLIEEHGFETIKLLHIAVFRGFFAMTTI